MFNERREQTGKLILARLIYLSVTARQVGYETCHARQNQQPLTYYLCF